MKEILSKLQEDIKLDRFLLIPALVNQRDPNIYNILTGIGELSTMLYAPLPRLCDMLYKSTIVVLTEPVHDPDLKILRLMLDVRYISEPLIYVDREKGEVVRL